MYQNLCQIGIFFYRKFVADTLRNLFSTDLAVRDLFLSLLIERFRWHISFRDDSITQIGLARHGNHSRDDSQRKNTEHR